VLDATCLNRLMSSTAAVKGLYGWLMIDFGAMVVYVQRAAVFEGERRKTKEKDFTTPSEEVQRKKKV